MACGTPIAFGGELRRDRGGSRRWLTSIRFRCAVNRMLPVANYVFADEWRVAADLEIVWTVLRRLEEWPDWWPSVRSLTRRYWGHHLG